VIVVELAEYRPEAEGVDIVRAVEMNSDGPTPGQYSAPSSDRLQRRRFTAFDPR